MSTSEQQYVEKLKYLILFVNIDPSNLQIQHLMFEAQSMVPSAEEGVLFNNLIDNTMEYRYLAQNLKGNNYTDEEHDKYYFLVRWFTNLNLYLNKFNTLLCRLPTFPD
jgi:hypothetical protein